MNKICGILRSLSKMWAIRNTGIPSNIRSRLNPFLANGPILYPLKTPVNQRFSGILRRYKMGTLARNGLTQPVNYLKEECSRKIYIIECYARNDNIIIITNNNWSKYVPVLSQNPSDRFRISDIVDRVLDSQSRGPWL